jgi:hypothetical protein
MMKKLLTLFICMVIVVCNYAQKPKEETPAPAKAAFAAKYPTAEKVKWSVEKPGEFEVEFMLNKVANSVLYDAAGKLLETEVEIKEAELPQDVKSTIAKEFEGYILNEIEMSTDAKGTITYKMEAVKWNDKLQLSFDASGKLLSKEPLKEEKEEKK